MSDFHVVAVRIGKALGLSEEEADLLIWRNQKQINQTALEEDVVAMLVIALVEQEGYYEGSYYEGSMSDLLVDLKQIAVDNGMNPYDLPSTPNHLSHHLKKIQSNLEEEKHIVFSIKNVGAFKKIQLGVATRDAA